MTRGLKRGTVALENYNPGWARDFEVERVELESIFGQSALAIEHVGSTAVPGLAAKPIIDIEVGLKNFKDWQKFTKSLEGIGYVFMPERIKDDEAFMPKDAEDNRTHYLHITEFGSEEWRKVIHFRDRLRSDESLRLEYENLKRKLAKKFIDDRKAYSKGKSGFIMEVIGIYE